MKFQSLKIKFLKQKKISSRFNFQKIKQILSSFISQLLLPMPYFVLQLQFLLFNTYKIYMQIPFKSTTSNQMIFINVSKNSAFLFVCFILHYSYYYKIPFTSKTSSLIQTRFLSCLKRQTHFVFTLQISVISMFRIHSTICLGATRGMEDPICIKHPYPSQ